MFSHNTTKANVLDQHLNKLKYVFVFLTITNILLVFANYQLYSRSQNYISFLAIGQGDSCLINLQRQQILIDGGPDNTVLEKLSAHLSPFDHTIEFLILTHPHEDHLAGLQYILENYQVHQIIIPKLAQPDTNLQDFISLAQEKKAIVTYGYYPLIIQNKQLSLKIIFPFDQNPQTNQNLNDISLVALVSNQTTNQKILLTGDISSTIEQQLIDHYQQTLDIDILKVAHHGSETSSSIPFLATTTPTAAIISSGVDNQFHHPAPETLEHLSQKNIKIYRTDLGQDITFPL